MKINKTVFNLGLACIFLTGCADEAPWGNTSSSGVGSIKLRLSSSGELSSAIPQMRSISSDIATPPVEDFQIRLVSSDNTYSKTWNSVSDFEKEEGFPAGIYTLEAYYGTPSSQGIVSDEENGYEHAYFYGVVEDLEVKAGETNTIQVQTALANSVLIVEYGEAFTNYFTDWTTTLYPEGKNSLELGNNEGKCFVVSGNVDIIIKATLQNGKSVRMNPGQLEVLPQHLYKIRYDVYNGEVGSVDQLVITFNDSTDEKDTIIIDLTDDLLSGEGPSITTEGFSSGDKIEVLQGNSYDGTVKFNVGSPDGITQALLTINSDSFKADFLSEGVVDLCSITPQMKEEMARMGIRMLGFQDNNPSLAMLDLSGFVAYLPEGKHDISLMVKDKALKVTDSYGIEVSTLPVGCEILETIAYYADGYADVRLNYNGADPTEIGKNLFSFKVDGESENEDAGIISINEKPYSTRGFDMHEYVYRIKLPGDKVDEFPLHLYYNGSSNSIVDSKISIIYPVYEAEFDAFARRLLVKVSNLRYENGERDASNLWNKVLDEVRILSSATGEVMNDREIDYESGLITFKDMTPGQDLGETKTSIHWKPSKAEHYHGVMNLRMEEALPVPNGDFSATDELLIDPINVGGQWTVSPKTYQTQSGIQRLVPSGDWANYNAKTCYLGNMGSAIPSSWAVVPSVYIEGNQVIIRSVGYSNNNISLGTTGGLFNTRYYCTNTPNLNNLSKQAGELFLGTYSFNGSDVRTDGIVFESRPDIFTFTYSYQPVGGEHGKMLLILKGEDGSYLGNFPIELTEGENKEITIKFENYPFNIKSKSLEISFKSSDTSSDPVIQLPSNLDEGVTVGDMTSIVTGGNVIRRSPNTYKAFASGSVLKISNLQFIYE